MGTPVAVVYANIVLFYLEESCLNYQPILYMRFIDDLFVVVKDQQQAHDIVATFNSQCNNIKLDAITIGNEGVFLDLKLRVKDNRIVTSLYQKPTNKYLYIPPFSDHSKTLLKNIIINEINVKIMTSSWTSIRNLNYD